MSGSWKEAKFAPKGVWLDVWYKDFGQTDFPMRAHKSSGGMWMDTDYDVIDEPSHYREIGKTPDGFVFNVKV